MPPLTTDSLPAERLVRGLTHEVDRVSETEWNRLLAGFADASVYHTWAYGAVSWGDSQLSHLVLSRDGDAIGLAQLRLVLVPVLRRGIAYLRWGPVCTRRDAPWDGAIYRAVLHAVIREYVENRRLQLRLVPRSFHQDAHSPEILRIWEELGLRPEASPVTYRTLRVDLTPPLEAIRKRLDQKWRNQLNGALRNNLDVAEGTGLDLFDQFLDLYRELMARKRFDTSVDPLEFRRIQERLPEDQKMWILISRKDGVPMTGLVGSVVGDMGIYLLGATSDEGMKTKGSYLLQWRMMEHLKERGCRSYDLGGINPETNPGVYHFKQGMSGDPADALPSHTLCRDPLSAAAARCGQWLSTLRARRRARAQ